MWALHMKTCVPFAMKLVSSVLSVHDTGYKLLRTVTHRFEIKRRSLKTYSNPNQQLSYNMAAQLPTVNESGVFVQ